MASATQSTALFREIHKNAWLRKLPVSERKGGALPRKGEKVWAVFCVHDDTEPFLELYSDQKIAAAHRPDVSVSLSSTLHISPTICPQDDEFEFVITMQSSDVIRLTAPTWESMLDWVESLCNKLREMHIVSPKENIYTRNPESRPPLLPTRDPNSPLPLPPSGTSSILAGTETSQNINSPTDSSFEGAVGGEGITGTGESNEALQTSLSFSNDGFYSSSRARTVCRTTSAPESRENVTVIEVSSDQTSVPTAFSFDMASVGSILEEVCEPLAPLCSPPLGRASLISRRRGNSLSLGDGESDRSLRDPVVTNSNSSSEVASDSNSSPTEDSLYEHVFLPSSSFTAMPFSHPPPALCARNVGIRRSFERHHPPAEVRSSHLEYPERTNRNPTERELAERRLLQRFRGLQPSQPFVRGIPCDMNSYRLTLREQQVLQLRKEMTHNGGVRLQLRQKDCIGSIALVDAFTGVWVAGWKQRDHPMLYSALHIGDQLVSVSGVIVKNSSDAQKLIKGSPSLYIELLIRRLPCGRVFALRRSTEGQDLGIILENKTPEIKDVVPGSLAAIGGLTPCLQTIDGLSLTSSFLTEINGRPLNLFFKDNEVKDRLNAVGLDISLLIQPSDLIRQIKKQLKTFRNYKDYIVQ